MAVNTPYFTRIGTQTSGCLQHALKKCRDENPKNRSLSGVFDGFFMAQWFRLLFSKHFKTPLTFKKHPPKSQKHEHLPQ